MFNGGPYHPAGEKVLGKRLHYTTLYYTIISDCNRIQFWDPTEHE